MSRDDSHMPYPSQPVLWWALINEMEAFTAVTGWGLASIWGFVHRGDYTQARAQFDQLRSSLVLRSKDPGCHQP